MYETRETPKQRRIAGLPTWHEELDMKILQDLHDLPTIFSILEANTAGKNNEKYVLKDEG